MAPCAIFVSVLETQRAPDSPPPPLLPWQKHVAGRGPTRYVESHGEMLHHLLGPPPLAGQRKEETLRGPKEKGDMANGVEDGVKENEDAMGDAVKDATKDDVINCAHVFLRGGWGRYVMTQTAAQHTTQGLQ